MTEMACSEETVRRQGPYSRERADIVAPNKRHTTEPVDRNHLWHGGTSFDSSEPALLNTTSSFFFPWSFPLRAHGGGASPPFSAAKHRCLAASSIEQQLPHDSSQRDPMAPQPSQSLRPSHAHAACRCSVAPLFGKRLPLVVAFPRTSGAVVTYCSAVQQSSTSTTVSKKKDAAGDEKATAAAAAKPAAKPKKAPEKPLPETMEEEIIPPLKAALEAEENVSQVELSFQNNTLEGSFVKEDVPYYFWAFFPKGDLTGPKGFAMSSYSNEVSTIEPFLVDEKRVSAKFVVFWVYKRLAGQGILPVWKDEEEEEAPKE